MPFLSPPDARYKESFIEAIREFQAEGRYEHLSIDALEADFSGYVSDRTQRRTRPAPDKVPESVFWLIADDGQTYIGRVSLRHELNDFLSRFGGHIGYDIRPSMRRQGYGMLICKLGLEEARKIGLRRAQLTVDEDNTASRKIIEANGGVLEGGEVIDRPGVLCLRFWIDLEELL